MASKRLALVPKVPISSSLVQSASQLKPRSSLSSPPPAISFKDLQDVLKRTALDINKEMKDLITAERAIIEETMERKNKEIRKDLLDVFQKLASHIEKTEVSENTERMEFRTTEVENKLEFIQDGSMEFALCIRGLKENLQENLKMLIVKDIAFNLGCRSEEVGDEIEKIYRVNSRIARQKMLPRDVVIYFFRRSIRNEIIQKAGLSSSLQTSKIEGLVMARVSPRKEQVEMAVQNFETKEQMITRAAHKRKEKEKQQKLQVGADG